MTPIQLPALHKYKHVAGNPLKLNTPVLTYLNKVDKHTANYACSGFGGKSAASFPTTKTRFALQIKALSGSTRPRREEFWVVFFFDGLSSRASNGCFRSPSLSWYIALWWGLTRGVNHFPSSYQSESVWPRLLIKHRLSAHVIIPPRSRIVWNGFSSASQRGALSLSLSLYILIISSLPELLNWVWYAWFGLT